MVKVLMRVDDVFDRLVRDELFRLLDHRDGPCVVLRTFDHDQVIAHFDQHAVMRAAGQIPDPVGHLVGLHLDGGLRDAVGRLDVGRNIGLGFGDGQIEGRLAAPFLADPGRELHPAEILVVRVDGFGQRVAEHRIGAPQFDFIDEVLVVDRGPGLEQVGDGERNDRGLFAVIALCLDSGIVLGRRLEDAVRRDPQLVQTIGDSDGRRDGRVLAHLVPGKLSAHRLRRFRVRGSGAPPPRAVGSPSARTYSSRIAGVS